MFKSILLSCFLVLNFSLFGQTKGVQPTYSEQKSIAGITRAVVIGISDYREEGIPDLNYAHRDAEEFVNYLMSDAGGALTDYQIELLLNEEATFGKIYEAIEWLIEVSKEGDKAVIYFSGHGDTETLTKDQSAFLLAHDAAPRSYVLGGALPLGFLKSVIATLSDRNVKILLVSDACRSGKLAGEGFDGKHLTLSRMKEKVGNEVNILSCQENEFSHEGEQWGGGRGAFSYHLIEGLLGLADKDNDQVISLLEIEDYLQDIVPEETDYSQIPIALGNMKSVVGNVDEPMLAQLREKKSLELPTLKSIGRKGVVEDLIADSDTSIQRLYNQFVAAIEKGNLMNPVGSSANDYFKALITIESIKPVQGYLKRSFVASLIDESQKSLSEWIFKPEREMVTWFSPTQVRNKYGKYPGYLYRAAELVGTNHYMYPHFMARMTLFEGGIQYLQKIYWKDQISGELALEKFRESLEWQPNSAHTHLWMAMTHFYNMQQSDSAYIHIRKAIDISPAWGLLHQWNAYFLIEEKKFNEAQAILDERHHSDSTNAFYWDTWAYWYFWQGKYKKTIEIYEKTLLMDSTAALIRGNRILVYGFLGEKEKALEVYNEIVKIDSLSGFPHYFLGNLFYLSGQYEKSIEPFEKALKYDPYMIWAYTQLGDAYTYLGRFEESEKILMEGYKLDSTYMPLVNAVGGVYLGKGDTKNAEKMFLRAIELDDTNWIPYFNLVFINIEHGKTDEAIEFFEIALSKGLKNYYNQYIKNNKDLEAIRNLAEFKILMDKYFPNRE